MCPLDSNARVSGWTACSYRILRSCWASESGTCTAHLATIRTRWFCSSRFPADSLWANGFGIVFPELEGQEAFAEVGATLDMIESLRPRIVIPGHGPVFTDFDAALAAARRRLDSFVKDPMRHAAHAAKVLLKFKLLELQRQRVADLQHWAGATPYVEVVHRLWFSDLTLPVWIECLADDLVRSGAARREGEWLENA